MELPSPDSIEIPIMPVTDIKTLFWNINVVYYEMEILICHEKKEEEYADKRIIRIWNGVSEDKSELINVIYMYIKHI